MSISITSAPINILICGGWILTQDRDSRIIRDGVVGISGSKIVYVGMENDLPAGIEVKERIDAQGCAIIPGLINTHGHFPMTLLRGLVEDQKLENWLNQVWIREREILSPEAVFQGSRLAICEMIRGGTTFAANMYWFPDQTARAAQEAGFRLADGPIFTDLSSASNHKGSSRSQAINYIQAHHGEALIHPIVQIHSICTDSLQKMEQAIQISEDYGIPFAMHAAETVREVEITKEKYGKTPIELFHQEKLLSKKVLLAHCVHLSDHEIEILAETGASVAHCPESNLKLGSGIARIPEMAAAKINICLGTDGVASNNNLDLFEEARTAALIQKGNYQDPTLMQAESVFKMLTINGARALGLSERIGSIEPGKLADIAIVDFNQPHLFPVNTIYTHLLYSANASDVRDTIINGRFVMRDHQLLTMDFKEIAFRVQEIMKIPGF
jgi:5-methylthioadenosine/S-adenosylhomocysteine deaminase